MIHITGHLPGFVRYLAAPFKQDGCDSVSNRRPAIHHLVLFLSDLSCGAFLSQSVYLIVSSMSDHSETRWLDTNVRSHLFALGLPCPYKDMSEAV